jgi:nitroreductase
MDVFLAIASRREVRDYADRPLPDDTVRRILEAGRIAGSSRNRQQRRFVVVADPYLREQLAESVYASGNVRGAALVVVVTGIGRGPVEFDVGRAAQNMMLAAWSEGVGSCPNGMPDPEAIARLLDLAEDERPVTVLTFGYPARPRDPERYSAEQWLEKADRLPFDELVRRS